MGRNDPAPASKELHYFLDEEKGCLSARPVPAEADIPKFPTPKFVFIISAPVLVTVNQEDANQSMKDFVHNSFPSLASSTTGCSPKKKLKIKMRSLIIKMVNNLIRQGLIAYEAIQVLSSAGNVQIRILVAHSMLSVLLERCERIGVGSVVGQCYASPIEFGMLPAIGPPREIVLPSGADTTTSTNVTTMSLNDETHGTAKTFLTEYEDGDGDSISSEEEEDEEGEEVAIDSLHTKVHIPFIGSERRKELQRQIDAAREEWKKTASRVRVEQVVEEVSAGAAFTLDYLAFCICASIIAAVGLATDSSASVIASMLVSPIMGPVLGLTFGTTIRRKSLILTSFRNEVVSLFVCLVVGSLMGLLCSNGSAPERHDWPTREMTSRGDVDGLRAGILVAIPSGMAVALSTLGKNSSSMTGVAISLSLLPPAVNAGLCWMYELMLLADVATRNEGDETKYWEIGAVSLALTGLNIICIWMGGVFIFWCKQVAPINKKNVFWSEDIKAARENEELHVDTDKIQDGLEAVLELNEGPTGFDLCEKGQYSNFNLTSTPLRGSRRKTFTASVTDDAFFLGGPDFGGGAVGDAPPAERKRRAALNRRATLRKATVGKSLLDIANQFGGLEGAGEALFDTDDSAANLIPHEIVAEQILVQDVLVDPKGQKPKSR